MSEYVPGKLEFWDEKPFLDAANILVAGDEPLLALKLLDSVPGYYRDNQPESFKEMRAAIYSLLATPSFYKNNPHDEMVRAEAAVSVLQGTLRGALIEKDMQAFQAEGRIPHIVDLGPGEYWLPIALHVKGFKFTYHDIGLSDAAREKALTHLGSHVSKKPASETQTVMFIACELIEHLHHERDILVDYLRAGSPADIIHISTPKYSYDVTKGKLNWRSCGDMGHLRTYTPKEFQDVVTSMFPGYEWGYAENEIMHMRGHKK